MSMMVGVEGWSNLQEAASRVSDEKGVNAEIIALCLDNHIEIDKHRGSLAVAIVADLETVKRVNQIAEELAINKQADREEREREWDREDLLEAAYEL